MTLLGAFLVASPVILGAGAVLLTGRLTTTVRAAPGVAFACLTHGLTKSFLRVVSVKPLRLAGGVRFREARPGESLPWRSASLPYNRSSGPW